MSHSGHGRSRAEAAPAVLVVSSDAGLREQVSAWVEEAGYQVVVCPGPRAGNSCIGMLGERCSLEVLADLTVLDLHPEGMSLGDRSGRAELVQIYRAGGRPVLVLADERMGEQQPETAGAAFLERSADRGALLSSVRELLAQSDPNIELVAGTRTRASLEVM